MCGSAVVLVRARARVCVALVSCASVCESRWGPMCLLCLSPAAQRRGVPGTPPAPHVLCATSLTLCCPSGTGTINTTPTTLPSLPRSCLCDVGYRGPDCSLVECPSNEDPLDEETCEKYDGWCVPFFLTLALAAWMIGARCGQCGLPVCIIAPRCAAPYTAQLPGQPSPSNECASAPLGDRTRDGRPVALTPTPSTTTAAPSHPVPLFACRPSVTCFALRRYTAGNNGDGNAILVGDWDTSGKTYYNPLRCVAVAAAAVAAIAVVAVVVDVVVVVVVVFVIFVVAFFVIWCGSAEAMTRGRVGVMVWCEVLRARQTHRSRRSRHRSLACVLPLASLHAPPACTVVSFYPCAGAPKGEFCSGRGTCDYKTGVCACADGYTGTACQQIEALA
jgi:hypothetical protein